MGLHVPLFPLPTPTFSLCRSWLACNVVTSTWLHSFKSCRMAPIHTPLPCLGLLKISSDPLAPSFSDGKLLLGPLPIPYFRFTLALFAPPPQPIIVDFKPISLFSSGLSLFHYFPLALSRVCHGGGTFGSWFPHWPLWYFSFPSRKFTYEFLGLDVESFHPFFLSPPFCTPLGLEPPNTYLGSFCGTNLLLFFYFSHLLNVSPPRNVCQGLVPAPVLPLDCYLFLFFVVAFSWQKANCEYWHSFLPKVFNPPPSISWASSFCGQLYFLRTGLSGVCLWKPVLVLPGVRWHRPNWSSCQPSPQQWSSLYFFFPLVPPFFQCLRNWGLRMLVPFPFLR